MPELVTLENTEDELARRAAVIKALGKRVARDIVEIGRLLIEAKALCKQRGEKWESWLEREFDWTERTALNFMQVHETFGKSEKFSDLSLPISGLYLLAKPSTPEEVRNEAIERTSNGEALSLAEVRKMIAQAKTAQEEATNKRIEELEAEFLKNRAEVEQQVRDEYEGSVTAKELANLLKKAVREATEPLQEELDELKGEKKKQTAAQKAKEAEAEKEARVLAKAQHQRALTSAFISVLDTLNYEPKHVTAFIKDIDLSGRNATTITRQRLRKAVVFLTAISKAKWSLPNG